MEVYSSKGQHLLYKVATKPREASVFSTQTWYLESFQCKIMRLFFLPDKVIFTAQKPNCGVSGCLGGSAWMTHTLHRINDQQQPIMPV